MSGRQEKGVAGHRPAQTQTQDARWLAQGGLGQTTELSLLGEEESASGGRRRYLRLAAIYARVSTDKQKKEQTIDSQLDVLRNAARDGDYELLEEYVFIDENYSGSRLDRPGLERLRDLASEGAFEAVLVCSPDRLARQYAYQFVVVEELQRAGCEVMFLNHGLGESPEERMFLQIQGVFAEYERALIQERTRRGRLFAARQGRVNWSHVPYGYRIIYKTQSAPQKLVVDETEAEVVRQMYRWLVEEELTSSAIAKRLGERGVPRPKGGDPSGWAQSTVSDMLTNPFYKGVGYYNRTKKVDATQPWMQKSYKDRRPGNLTSKTLRPKEEWIRVRVPAIIDPEMWDLAQEQLKKNGQRAQRNNKKHSYLLRGLLVCGRCGRRMMGRWGKPGGYYVCKFRYPKSAPGSCEGRMVMTKEIELVVWEYVKGLLSDCELLKARYEEGKGDPAVEAPQEREKERIERRLKALEREVGRLIDAYQAEVIELCELRERRARIEEHGQMLKERLKEIERRRTDREQEIRLLEGVEEFLASIREALEEPSFETKQRVLRLVVDRIVVDDSKVVVHHVVPTGPVHLQTERQSANGSSQEALSPTSASSLCRTQKLF
ncbi:MAG: recombinase family protein [Actinobacteria bacterium]|nr:recombinase family protein [Actinomycetota bacterium]